jgi:NarL family two-component system sensor histidine kinase LiaS
MSLAIVDTAGQVLISYPAGTFATGAALPVSAEAMASFQAALRGETDSTKLAFRDAVGNIVAAAPIFGSRRQLVGVLYAEVAPPLDEAEFLQIVLRQTVLPVVLGVLVVGVIAGVLFGYFIARDLTRRLRALAGAADAWSDGNFDVLVTDNSGDELGQLAHRLNQMALQLQTLLHTRQELATLDERNRLARDLHDAVKQQVFATAMQVGAALALFDQNPAAAKARLVETDQLVRQTQQELTILIQELRPAALKDKGLTTALREYVADWSRQNNIAAEVRVRGEQSMSFLQEQSLFRVTQEALANIARHSGATQVEVELAWEGDQVALSLADNGRGFNPATTNGKGVGLRSMRERVEAIGGQLSVTSQPGAGTQVTVRCKKTQKA